jgi:putative endopeptidase
MRYALLAAASAAILALASQGAQAADPAPDANIAPSHFGKWGLDLTSEDHAVKPGDDFFSYGDGAWYARTTIPADQASTGVGRMVYNRAQANLRTLIEESARDPKTHTAQQVGGLYKAFMDEARVEALDDKPLRAKLAKIAAISDKAQFSAFMADTNGGLGKSLFGVGVLPDPLHPEVNTLFVGQDGLGLPDRDYYLDPKFKPQLAAYRAFVERALTMVGYKDPAASADAILALETHIAEVSWTAADRHDIAKLFNPMTLADFEAYAPGFDWSAYFEESGIHGQTKLVAGEKSAIQKIAAIYAETPLDTLKAWETFHYVADASPYLSKRFVDSQFDYAKSLSGVSQQLPRWKRGVTLVQSSLGEAVGAEYVAHYFPPASKAKMQALVANLKTALAARIEKADWLAPTTKKEALLKLSKMDVQVGYPDKFRDYSALKIDDQDLLGDVERSAAFEWAYSISDLGKPVDHKKWGMTPQTVNAYNGGLENKIVFPAGILQAPFFDPDADPAVNYGAIGAVIGHEITHGFDNSGRKIDSTGKLRDWWTADDAKRFEIEAAKFGAQYDSYEPVPGSHINGKLTMGENIADLGGLLVALDAYHASLGGKPAPVIDGLTGDQRFFLAFAQVWENKTRDDALRQQIATNEHSPAKFRVIGPTRNVDAWYAAFDVKDGQYYLKPEDRVRIW